MSTDNTRKALLTALFLMALAGLMLHLRIHPFLAPDKQNPEILLFRPSFLLASILPLLDVVVVTALFASKRTAVWGYLINGLIVIYGTVLMGHFSIAMLAPKNPPFYAWILKSTLPDIGLAWADFLVGKVLYDTWTKKQ